MTTFDNQANGIVERLTRGEKTWAATSLDIRAELLAQMIALVDEHSAEWVELAASIKAIPVGSSVVGEEWITGPWAAVTSLAALKQTVEKLARGREALAGFSFRPAPGDRVAVEVLPHSVYDRLLLNGFSAQVWLEPGVTKEQAQSSAGLGLRDPSATRGVALVLGAGNIFSIAPLDAIYMLYAENRTVALKLNPITDPLKPVFEKVFAPYIELGVIEILSGPIELGSTLAYHSDVAAVHMTGSEQTHDTIVWGAGDGGRAAKATGRPKLNKPITSELGGVAPVIVVPGRWSRADLRFQAQHVATQRLHNSGSNCVAAQVVILSRDWVQKDDFLAELRRAFAEAPARPAWYPGSDARIASARSTHRGHVVKPGGTPERTLLTLNMADSADPAFRSEYFAPVLGITELPGTGADFLRHAVAAANATLRGTLGANVIVHPRERRALGPDLLLILAELRYGTIGVNAWTGVGYLTPFATWGAFPGHRLEDIQSGVGVVHNSALIAQPERTVVQGPFRSAPRSILHGEWTISPKPPWFVNNRTAATTGKRLTRFAARPGLRRLFAIFASALRG